MQLRSSASQYHVFACGSMVRTDLVCTVFPRYARKNRTRLERSAPLCRRHNTPTA